MTIAFGSRPKCATCALMLTHFPTAWSKKYQHLWCVLWPGGSTLTPDCKATGLVVGCTGGPAWVRA